MNNKLTTPNNKTNILLAGLKNLRVALSDLSLDQFVVNTLEVLMYLERDEYLQELKALGTQDKGNGTYPRSFKSFSKNALVINIPRTRYTDFKPLVIEFLKYSQERINELVLKLYRKGMTTRDISELLKDFFGEEMSYSQVSVLAERFHEIRQAWENSPLEKHYKVAYCDALYMTLRRGESYAKEAVQIIYGVREDNKRELLSLSVNPRESTDSWSTDLAKLKERQIATIDLIVADGFRGLENEIHKHFPGTIFQKCVVHKVRNVLSKVRVKDKKQIADELRGVFNNIESTSTVAEGLNKVASFLDRWSTSYPNLKRYFADETLEYYFSYLKFPFSIRKMLYTTNSIESLNKKIRKATKNKQSFEKEERLLDYIFIIIKDFENENWMKYPVSAFSNWTQSD